MRDDFSAKTKDNLARRVGFRCSNPDCRKTTSGPSDEDQNKHISIGVAAHICAASQGGPRYDKTMSPEERASFDNGIWLCQSCAKMIDDDTKHFSIERLRVWKSTAEQLALVELKSNPLSQANIEDKEIIKFFAKCFDRPAFQHPIVQEGNMENFEKAIEDTIIALNTGVLRDRDGQILRSSEGKSSIVNPSWRTKIDTIVDMLVAISHRLLIAKQDRVYWQQGHGLYCFNDRDIQEWFDATRFEIIKIFSSICEEAGLSGLQFPRHRYRW